MSRKTITEQKTLPYQGRKIRYTLKVRDQKNIILKLQNNEITVSAPYYADMWQIEQLLYRNIHKIEKYIALAATYKLYDFDSSEKFVKIWGKNTPFLFHDEIVEQTPKNVLVFRHYETENETLLKMYNKLKAIYEVQFISRLNYWAQVMELSYKNLSVRYFKGKWGICYPTKEKILLNIRLVNYDMKALDYVCVHELAHLVHHNHSRDFWHLIECYLSQYKTYAEILKISLK